MKLVRLLIVLLVVTSLSGCQLYNYYVNKDSEKKMIVKNDGQVQVPQEQDDKTSETEDDETTVQPEEEVLTLPEEYFNDTTVVDGKMVINNPENIVALVNKEYSLTENYIPTDLVKPNVPFSFGEEKLEKSLMREEAAQALEALFLGAKVNGIELFAVSGYRSYERQAIILDNEISKVGEAKAIEAVAFPGQSEHQTGLAMDISSKSVNLELTQDFKNVAEGNWLANNAHLYGFILRYPEGKETVTRYKFEPWHFRYVGQDVAKVIYEKKLTLEEYFKLVKQV
ncbi:M15 family metallopeptidase [Peribacillus alkalitolerans]|uniref:M15 family metallopeptidase n=1 Tax=Peribacillus alkalitolerans TaxID=1550385 RepID=UPI0013CF9CC4|nr:M15 family metallopeptidase [Peribacillus alkalitolerans]